jgi:hypothetical protein
MQTKVNARVIKILTEKDIVGNGDLVVLTKGMHKGESGGTNQLDFSRLLYKHRAWSSLHSLDNHLLPFLQIASLQSD